MDDALAALWLALAAHDREVAVLEAAKDRVAAATDGLTEAVRGVALAATTPGERTEALRAVYWGCRNLKPLVIAEAFGVRLQDLSIIAGPAEGHGIRCSACGEELPVTSRTARKEYLSGERPRVCRRCKAVS